MKRLASIRRGSFSSAMRSCRWSRRKKKPTNKISRKNAGAPSWNRQRFFTCCFHRLAAWTWPTCFCQSDRRTTIRPTKGKPPGRYKRRQSTAIERCSFSGIKNPHLTVGIFSLIQGPANDLQHGTWVIILAQQGREDQGKQDIRKFLCGKLLRERIRTNLCIPLQDRTQAR